MPYVYLFLLEGTLSSEEHKAELPVLKCQRQGKISEANPECLAVKTSWSNPRTILHVDDVQRWFTRQILGTSQKHELLQVGTPIQKSNIWVQVQTIRFNQLRIIVLF